METRFIVSERSARIFLVAVIIVEICMVAVFLTYELLDKQGLFIHRLFNLDSEKNIPALFSSAQLFLVGLVFLSIAYQSRQTRFYSPLFLTALGTAFIFLAFDEAFSIHERITYSLVHIEWIPRFKGDHGIWVAPYLFAGLVFFLLTYKQFLKMWKESRRETTIMASGIVIFMVGVVGLEVIGYQLLGEGSSISHLYTLEVALEEFLEMMGISIVLYGAVTLRQI